MGKIELDIIEALTTALMIAVDEHKHAVGTDEENVTLFRMNFIKQFTTDINFLNDLSENDIFYHRYINLIMRNMVEQLIEFLYISKNRELIDEYLGYAIDLKKMRRKKVVAAEKSFGENRFLKTRAKISEMAKDIGEKKVPNREMSLYDVYSILSEKSHNSYFASLIDDFNAVNAGVPRTGLTQEQITLIHIMVLYVLPEYLKK